MFGTPLTLFTVEGRMKTFTRTFKAPSAKKCTPENLARAGFYYIGSKKYADLVKCFACDKELGDWEPDDDPWLEHQRSVNCPFVKLKLKKGEDLTVRDFYDLFIDVAVFKKNNQFNEDISELTTIYESLLDHCDK